VNDLTTGALRIGIHVIDFESGGSESFINVPVPEPGTGLLLAFGLLDPGAKRRSDRSRRQSFEPGCSSTQIGES